jgi:hypothetical protein
MTNDMFGIESRPSGVPSGRVFRIDGNPGLKYPGLKSCPGLKSWSINRDAFSIGPDSGVADVGRISGFQSGVTVAITKVATPPDAEGITVNNPGFQSGVTAESDAEGIKVNSPGFQSGVTVESRTNCVLKGRRKR